MKIHCPACGAKISAEQINIKALVAVCAACDDVFQIDQPNRGLVPVTLPKGLSKDGRKRLVWGLSRWRVAGAFTSLLGLLFVKTGIEMAVALPGNQSWMSFLIIGAGFGGVLTYLGTCFALNRWRLSIDEEYLVVRYRPVPLRRSRRIPRTSIQQLYVHERRAAVQRNTRCVYDVFVQQKSGRAIPLVTSLIDPALAAYIVWHVESELGLIHRPVAGEYVAAPHVLARNDGQAGIGTLQLAAEGGSDTQGAMSLTDQEDDA